MAQRTVERFRKRAIAMHWVHAASFIVLLITGGLMFFSLTGFNGGREVRAIHCVAAVFLVALPVLYSLVDRGAARGFIRESFCWTREDIRWLKSSVSYYFGSETQMPPQGRINGDQKLWQLVVAVTGIIFALTGIILWFLKLKIPTVPYQWVRLTHAAAFVVVSVGFLIHFYLRTFHPRLDESLSSMLDGKVSESYAIEHYRTWYETKMSRKHEPSKADS